MHVWRARLGPYEISLREYPSGRILRLLARAPVHAVLVVVGLLWLVPTLGLLFTSLLSAAQFNNAGWWRVLSHPSLATWQNYRELFHNEAIRTALLTTAEIAVGGTVLPIIVGALAGYAFAWLDFPGRDWLFIGVIAMLVVPLQMALIPMFKVYNDVGLFDTVIGLILFHTAFGLPFAIPLDNSGLSSAKDLADPEGRFIDVDGLQTYVLEQGPADGQPLVTASRLLTKTPLPERVATTDLYPIVARMAQDFLDLRIAAPAIDFRHDGGEAGALRHEP